MGPVGVGNHPRLALVVVETVGCNWNRIMVGLGCEGFWGSLLLNEHANVALPFLVEEERPPNQQGREFAKAVREQKGR